MKGILRNGGFAVIASVIGTLLAMPASADPIILDTWNESDIQGSGDVVEVIIGENDGRTTLTFQWQENDTGDDLWTAIGLDIIFYNSSVTVLYVRDQDGNDVTSGWNLNFGGTNSGGGFGSMLSKKNLDSGGTGGIDPNSITLILNGIATIGANTDGNMFATHIRYGQDCSGWVSEGSPDSVESTGNCGSVVVPEPAPLALLGIGLLALGANRARATRS